MDPYAVIHTAKIVFTTPGVYMDQFEQAWYGRNQNSELLDTWVAGSL